MDQGEPGTTGEMRGSSNVLITGTPAELQRTCADRIHATDPDSNAIVVTYGKSAEEWLSDVQPATETTIISVGEATRSTATATPASTDVPPSPRGEPCIDGVGDPTDLTTLGLTIRDHLQPYAETENEETILCFDSINALLEAVPVSRAFRFLHILTVLVTRYDATAYYHLHPGLNQADLDTVRILFDESSPVETSDTLE